MIIKESPEPKTGGKDMMTYWFIVLSNSIQHVYSNTAVHEYFTIKFSTCQSYD